MTAPTFLELALLSMDVYQQALGGLNNGHGLGQFELGEGDRTGSGGTFAAQEYTFDSGTVIAYQGSDGGYDYTHHNIPASLGFDGPTGQDIAAAAFYQTVTGGVTSRSDVILTGHSLGGSLAGFVGSLYETTAVLFNNVGNFFQKATSAIEIAANPNPTGTINIIARDQYRDWFFDGAAPSGIATLSPISGLVAPGEVAFLTRVGDEFNPQYAPIFYNSPRSPQ